MNYDRQVHNICELEKTVIAAETTPKSVDPGAVALALRILSEHYRKTQQEIGMNGVRGAPDWAQYELSIWKLSERIREYLKACRDLRGKNDVLDAIVDIVVKREYGKGRQNFILILGQYGGSTYTGPLGKLLDDHEVVGHAIKALKKAKATEYSREVEQIFSETRIGWIRTVAREYLDIVRKMQSKP